MRKTNGYTTVLVVFGAYVCRPSGSIRRCKVNLRVHRSQGIASLRQTLVPDSIRFPTGGELKQVMCDFESLAGLPMCGGAMDGTFMAIEKPEVFGDSYYCYKKFTAIIILACVDARGIFTSVNAGRAGSLGVAFAFNNRVLHQKLETREWLSSHTRVLIGVTVEPFLVADAAFALSSKVLKCSVGDNLSHRQHAFNYCIIRTRRVVEQAFGRLKGRFHTIVRSRLKNPGFAAKVASVCCSLHNICEHANCPFEDGWLPDPDHYAEHKDEEINDDVIHTAVADIRNAVAQHVEEKLL